MTFDLAKRPPPHSGFQDATDACGVTIYVGGGVDLTIPALDFWDFHADLPDDKKTVEAWLSRHGYKLTTAWTVPTEPCPADIGREYSWEAQFKPA